MSDGQETGAMQGNTRAKVWPNGCRKKTKGIYTYIYIYHLQVVHSTYIFQIRHEVSQLKQRMVYCFGLQQAWEYQADW